MKIVIDISEEYYAVCKEKAKSNIGTCTTIAKGIPLEKVFENIKAEIDEVRNNALGYPNWEYAKGLEMALNIMDRHINGKDGE